MAVKLVRELRHARYMRALLYLRLLQSRGGFFGELFEVNWIYPRLLLSTEVVHICRRARPVEFATVGG